MYQLLFYSDDTGSVSEMQFLSAAVEVPVRIQRTFADNVEFQRVTVIFRSDPLYSMDRQGRRWTPVDHANQAAA